MNGQIGRTVWLFPEFGIQSSGDGKCDCVMCVMGRISLGRIEQMSSITQLIIDTNFAILLLAIAMVIFGVFNLLEA